MTLVFLILATLASAEIPEITLAPAAGALRLAVTGDTGQGTEILARAISRVHAKSPFDAILWRPLLPVRGEAVPEAQTQATGVIPRWRFPAPQYVLEPARRPCTTPRDGHARAGSQAGSVSRQDIDIGIQPSSSFLSRLR